MSKCWIQKDVISMLLSGTLMTNLQVFPNKYNYPKNFNNSLNYHLTIKYFIGVNCTFPDLITFFMFLEYASIPEREEEIIRRNLKTRLSKNTGST